MTERKAAEEASRHRADQATAEGLPRPDWDSGNVPLSSLIRGSGTTPTRLVLFRRPLEHRASDRAELEAIVLTVLVEQVAELLGIPASEVDPRYPDD